jgi:hypothetical protein
MARVFWDASLASFVNDSNAIFVGNQLRPLSAKLGRHFIECVIG